MLASPQGPNFVRILLISTNPIEDTSILFNIHSYMANLTYPAKYYDTCGIRTHALSNRHLKPAP